MKCPLVTISIPIYNAEEFLDDAIKSCINQTYKHWELLLINDGSTDSSLSIMKYYSCQDSRIKVYDDGVNKGLVYRLNQSISLAEGSYYARMDADDIMSVTRIQKQVDYLESHKNVDVLGSSIMRIDVNNNIIGSALSDGYVSTFIHPTVMGRIQWFKENQYSDWAIRAEDAELWCRTSKKSVFYSLKEPLLFYREFGIPTMEKYHQTQKTLLLIYKRYKIYGKSLSWALSNTLLAVIKIVINKILGILNHEHLMVYLRRWKSVPYYIELSRTDLDKAIKE